jgi:signal recognition particle receptor subunit beta
VSTPRTCFALACRVQGSFVSGQERFRSVATSSLHGIHLLLFVFDCSDATTLDDLLSFWFPLALDAVPSDTCFVVLGNKSDRLAPSALPAARSDLDKLSASLREMLLSRGLSGKVHSFLTSAKDGTGLVPALDAILTQAAHVADHRDAPASAPPVDITSVAPSSSSCCVGALI